MQVGVGQVFIGHYLAVAPYFQVSLVRVDDYDVILIGSEHLGDDAPEGIFQYAHHDGAVDVLQLLELGEGIHQADCFFFLDDICITKLPMFRRAHLGISYLPQEASVFKKLTVEQNIWAILEHRRDLSRSERKRKLDELIDEFAIGRIRKQPAYTLSGGERRRTEIARSLAIEPKFLLLDEPFAGIDPIAVSDIKGMVELLAKRGIGVLITDHNVRDTLEITDRAIIISSGQIVAQGNKNAILESPIARKIYLGEEFRM